MIRKKNRKHSYNVSDNLLACVQLYIVLLDIIESRDFLFTTDRTLFTVTRII